MSTATEKQELRKDLADMRYASQDWCLKQFGGPTDRGDPAAADRGQADFTKDGNWYDWDLSSVVTNKRAKLILFHIQGKSASTNVWFELRKNGNSNNVAIGGLNIDVANITQYQDVIIPCDSNQVVEYRVANASSWTILSVTVKAWWT